MKNIKYKSIEERFDKARSSLQMTMEEILSSNLNNCTAAVVINTNPFMIMNHALIVLLNTFGSFTTVAISIKIFRTKTACDLTTDIVKCQAEGSITSSSASVFIMGLLLLGLERSLATCFSHSYERVHFKVIGSVLAALGVSFPYKFIGNIFGILVTR
uniref:7TM_GPCR_Srx domain-containing protein n=1 Tax=Heterorhabditis bacteriophora TaxID=37862 RepID=A0A1I7WSG1_HETBA